MARELTSRFAGRIRWIGFENQSGQDIPPYSIIEASGWQMPDPSGSDISVTSPIILADQPEDPINPYACYITGAGAVAAGSYGVCAQPSLDLPLLVALSGSQQDSNDKPFRLCGPTDGDWTATRGMPGFAVVDSPQQGYALVVPTQGPYAASLPENTPNTAGNVTVTLTSTENQSTMQVYNPFENIDTTQLDGASLRCTIDWVWGSNQWELIAYPRSRVFIRGKLQTALAQGSSTKLTTAAGAVETVREALGLNGGTIPNGTNVTAFFNFDTRQWEIVSTGCAAG